MFNDCIIMAGGSGNRLWPASNSRTPKQFLTLKGGRSFFQTAMDRALSVIDTEKDGKVIVICGAAHVHLAVDAIKGYSREEKQRVVIIPEPDAKNTGPAIACGTNYADWASGQERTILVLTSDHIISPLESFLADAAAAALLAKRKCLVVFGIPPKRPETGYGYIEVKGALPINPDEETAEQGGRQAGQGAAAYNVASFHEKPDLENAEAFFASGKHFWNSGMFAFSSRFLLEEFRLNSPEVIKPFDRLRCPDDRSYSVQDGVRILKAWLDLGAAYSEARNISFDYAIAEKCKKRAMVAASFDWLDVGSWDEYVKLAGDAGAEVYLSGAKNCYVDSDLPVSLVGVEDLIVVVRSEKHGGPPSVLISKKGASQGVREIVDQIKAAGRKELL